MDKERPSYPLARSPAAATAALGRARVQRAARATAWPVSAVLPGTLLCRAYPVSSVTFVIGASEIKYQE